MTRFPHFLATGTILLALALPAAGAPLELTPFFTQNQSPLIQIFGLPPADSATLTAPGKIQLRLTADVANDYAVDNNGLESVTIDVESYRFTFDLRYGITPWAELGLEIPVVVYAGGFLDNFIINFHDAFGLPQNGRKSAPRNQVLVSYERNGQTLLNVQESSAGIGDLRLTGGVQLYHDRTKNPAALALRGSLKLPTGDSDLLHGSGATDFALWLTGSKDFPLGDGHLTLFGAAGGLVMGTGDVLPELQRSVAAFWNGGLGWAPTDWIGFKLQFSGNTPCYQDSSLRPLSLTAWQLTFGGTLAFGERTTLDIGISEDLQVDASPDATFNLSLTHRF